MTATIINGKAIAEKLRARVAAEVARLVSAHGVTPGMAVVQVGHNPASEVYVRSKTREVAAAGMRSFDHRLPEDIGEAELLALLARLNADHAVHGILVQLPLPAHIDAQKVINAIDPAKDVDGFHPLNVGRLAIGLPVMVPCTPMGCIILARTMHPSFTGLDAVVIGRSNVVGRPLVHMLIGESATVTIAHSKTRDLPALCRDKDLVFTAIGQAELVRGDWIKPGATVIDIGINRVVAADGRSRIVGDVAFEEVCAVAGAITPVPGGVGPMTIACLLVNTLRAAFAASNLAAPAL
ncbi:MAG TPA: bifunctional methylenetetrahydrofolate dehydrogenase/methenyltetrahydrofolate cyclohydrolase FolD [Xanthobacteraceae bacterium]|jgi:methylenetetrahydrofolate dehydrogenase (NADP+)/methenyltetrahydrofolate cyclohydrolase